MSFTTNIQTIVHLLVILGSIQHGYTLRKNKFISPPPPSPYCLVPNVECVDLHAEKRHCLSTQLTYTATSSIFVQDTENLTDVFESLEKWSVFKSVPECWNVIQPFLCSVYLPRCENGVAERSSLELCEIVRSSCQIVGNTVGWPEFLRCEASHFRRGCYPLATRQKYNRSVCSAPLVSTTNPSSYYEDVKGCGVHCKNPTFTTSEHYMVHNLIGVMAVTCLFSTLFAIMTFCIDWKAGSRYPGVILFYVNVCFCMSVVGWLLQFLGLRDSIVCRSDGAVRIDEPKINEGESGWCTIVFFVIYFFMMAGVMWFAALAFSWHLYFQTLVTSCDRIERNMTYLHLLSWTLSLLLTIIALAISKIEGDSLSGICFVGYVNHGMRAGLVLAPVGLAFAFGLFFLIKCLMTLTRVKLTCPEFNDEAAAKVQTTIVRIFIFLFICSALALTSFSIHIYMFFNDYEWRQSFRAHLICLIEKQSSTSAEEECVIKSRPHLGAILGNIGCYFGAGIAMSSWVWNEATWRSWRRFCKTKLARRRVRTVKNDGLNTEDVVRTGEVARAVPSESVHEDPIGMHFDIDSASSRPASSIVMKRLPMTGRYKHRVPRAGQRRHSDSDVQSVTSYVSRRTGESLHNPDSSHRNPFYSRHGSDGLDVRQWARQAAKWTRRKNFKPRVAPNAAFHKQHIKIHKRHEAALERAESEFSSDNVSEMSIAVFDRNLPLPPIGTAQDHRPKRPDYSIFVAGCFAPGELRRLSDPLGKAEIPSGKLDCTTEIDAPLNLVPDEPLVVSPAEDKSFKKPDPIFVAADNDDDDISVLDM